MGKQIYINLPVSNLAVSTAFYGALGFTQNPNFTDENASSMQWSDDIVVMLLKDDFYKTFLRGKTISDAKATSSVLLAISFDTKEEVQKFADTAKEHGGDFYQVDTGVSPDMMFGYEVEDPDGHTWEPIWMSPDFNPQNN